MSANSYCPTRLLLVDDDPELLELWEHVLREAFDGQIHIDALSDSNAAIKLVQRHSFDILVTDLSMPDVNRLDLIRCVQSRNRCAQTLLITGTSTVESLLESVDLGAADYLLKPIQPEQLIEVVRSADARLNRWRVALAGAFRRKYAQTESPC